MLNVCKRISVGNAFFIFNLFSDIKCMQSWTDYRMRLKECSLKLFAKKLFYISTPILNITSQNLNSKFCYRYFVNNLFKWISISAGCKVNKLFYVDKNSNILLAFEKRWKVFDVFEMKQLFGKRTFRLDRLRKGCDAVVHAFLTAFIKNVLTACKTCKRQRRLQ